MTHVKNSDLLHKELHEKKEKKITTADLKDFVHALKLWKAHVKIEEKQTN